MTGLHPPKHPLTCISVPNKLLVQFEAKFEVEHDPEEDKPTIFSILFFADSNVNRRDLKDWDINQKILLDCPKGCNFYQLWEKTKNEEELDHTEEAFSQLVIRIKETGQELLTETLKDLLSESPSNITISYAIFNLANVLLIKMKEFPLISWELQKLLYHQIDDKEKNG